MVLVKTADATRVTQSLADFASSVTFADLPPAAVREAKRLILDTVGCALGGYTSERGRIIRNVARSLGGNPESTIIGNGVKVSCTNAALANGDMANVLDNDETCLNSGHNSAPLVPAALAIAEKKKASGKDLITAVAVGYDINTRIGFAADAPMAPQFRGEPPPEVSGSSYAAFGAATAAGQILKLNREQMLNCVGLAGMLAPIPSSGKYLEERQMAVKEKRHLMCKYHAPGWLAQAGLTAALMAEAGYGGPHTILDGEKGFWKMSGSKTCDFDFMVSQLGEKWWITEGVQYKIGPSCQQTQTPLTVFTRVIKKHNLKAEEIEKVVYTAGLEAYMFKELFWQKDLEAALIIDPYFSVPLCLALAAYNVPPGPEWHYFRWRPLEPKLAEFMQKVDCEPDPEALAMLKEAFNGPAPRRFKRCPASIRVYARGKVFEDRVEWVKGDSWLPEAALTDEELKEKFRLNAVDVLKGSSGWLKKIDGAMEMMLDLDKVKDINELTALLAP